MFVLTGDNGGTYEHGFPVPGSSNYPLRGHKYSYFEGGVRTATFVWSQALLPSTVRGTTTGALISVADWYATFAALAHTSVGDAGTDSVNQWPVITGQPSIRGRDGGVAVVGRTELVIGVGGGATGAYRNGSYKLIMPGGNAEAADGWSAQYPGK